MTTPTTSGPAALLCELLREMIARAEEARTGTQAIRRIYDLTAEANRLAVHLKLAMGLPPDRAPLPIVEIDSPVEGVTSLDEITSSEAVVRIWDPTGTGYITSVDWLPQGPGLPVPDGAVELMAEDVEELSAGKIPAKLRGGQVGVFHFGEQPPEVDEQDLHHTLLVALGAWHRLAEAGRDEAIEIPETPRQDELDILTVLAQAERVLHLHDIAERLPHDRPLSEATISARMCGSDKCPGLESRGYCERVGTRGGFRITNPGRRLLKMFAA